MQKLVTYFIAFIFLFYIPITATTYYEIVHMQFLFNIYILYFLILILLILLTYKISNINYKLTNLEIFILFIGFSMSIYTSTFIFLGVPSNFSTTSIVLLIGLMIFDLRIGQVKYILYIVSSVLILFTLLTFIDTYFGLSLSPIKEIRYYSFSELDNIRLINNSLFGQKNALGGIVSILVLLLLYVNKYFNKTKKKSFFTYLLVIGLILILILSTSMSGILIILGFFLVSVLNKKILLSIVTIGTIVLLSNPDFNLFEIIEYKIFSAEAKINRINEFLMLLDNNPTILFFGYGENFYTESSLLDLIIEFGLLIPLFLILYLFYLMLNLFVTKDFIGLYITISFFTLLVIQNSSFLVPNILLLIIFSYFYIYNKKIKSLKVG